jgi:post-segregation antitoxin (ccd killing protein)
MSANNKSKVNVWIDKELYKAARTLAIQHELNWSTVIEEGLRLIIAELKKK